MKTISIKKIFISLILIATLCFSAFTAIVVQADRVTTLNDTIEIYQLAPESGSLMEAYVIKTKNDKLIVIDGGIDGVVDGGGLLGKPYLPSALRAIAGVGEGEYFEVEAWFLSHAHSDHFFELAKMLDAYTTSFKYVGSDTDGDGKENYIWEADTNYKIKNFYFDFPTDFSHYPAGDMSQSNLNFLKSGLDKYATENEIQITGESYYDDLNGAVINADAIKQGLNIEIDGVNFAILQTWHESDTLVNSNSTIIRMQYEGQSLLFLNDATVASSKRLLETYGAEALESDIIQMAHHGQAGSDKDFYTAIKASEKVRLWPASTYVWNMDTTAEVRTWLGLPSVPFSSNTIKDVVAGLYAEYPADRQSVSDWADVVDGMKISFPYLGVYGAPFESVQGAEVRFNPDSTGVRFKAKLTSYDPEAEYGFVIVPRDYLDDNGITSNFVEELTDIYGADGFIKLYSNVLENGVVYEIQGSISNIKYSNINREFAGIAFEYKDGVYTYADFESLDDISMSAGSVAIKSYNKHLYGSEGALYDADELEVIQSFATKSLNKKADAAEDATPNTDMVFSEEEYQLKFAESAEYSLNTLFDEEDIFWEISNPNVVVLEDGIMRTIGVGETTISAKCYGKESTINVSVDMEDTYCATYDNEGYVNTMSFESDDTETQVVATYLETFEGEEDVLKLHVNVPGANKWTKIFLDLGRTHGGKYTIKYYLDTESTRPNYFRINNKAGSVGGDVEYSDSDNTLPQRFGTWLEESFACKTGDNSVFNFQFINTSGGCEFDIYVSYIYDTDAHIQKQMQGIIDKLPTGYVADFNDPIYAELVSFSAGTNSVETTTFDGTDVLKANISAAKNTWVKMTINLPKAMTIGGQYKVRYYVVANGGSLPNYFRINNITGAMGGDLEYNPVGGAWEERILTNLEKHPNYSYLKDANTFNFQAINTSSALGFTLYVDFIYDISAAEDALADALSEGYCAQFNDSAYANFVSFGAITGADIDSGKASIVEFDGIKALKIEITDTSWGSFKVVLPKEYGDSYTLKYYFDYHYDTDGTTKLGIPGYFRFNSAYGTTKSDKEYESSNPPSNLFGKWTVETFNTGSQVESRKSLTFSFINTSGTSNFTMYLAFVYNGAMPQ